MEKIRCPKCKKTKYVSRIRYNFYGCSNCKKTFSGFTNLLGGKIK